MRRICAFNSTLLKKSSFVFCICSLATTLLSCGGSSSPMKPPPLPVSTWGPNSGHGPVAFSLLVPRSSITGWTDTSIFQATSACGLQASNVQMEFLAASSGTWFTVSPSVGTIPAGGRTDIGVPLINATGLPAGLNTGVIFVTAPGYQDNSQLTFKLTCGIVGSKGEACDYSWACPPLKP